MQRKFTLLVAVCCIALNAAMIFGQEKPLEKVRFGSEVETATPELKKKSYRSSSIYEIFDDRDAAPVRSYKTVIESTAAGGFHSISEGGGQRSEVIKVGGKTYSRTGNENWKEGASDVLRAGDGCGASNVSETYKMTAGLSLNGKSVILYEKIERLEGYSCGSEESRDEIRTDRYWITTDGLLIKKENLIEGLETKSLKRNTVTYEYDPTIRIEAPISQAANN